MPELYDLVARLAINDLIENGGEMKADRLADATYFAAAAYADMKLLSTYDPNADAVGLAQRAAVEYVKGRLLGREPTTLQTYMTSFQLWQRSAAMERHKVRKRGRIYHHFRTLDRSDKYEDNRY